MRRTRWDQKPDIEDSVASGSRWNGQCPVEWEHHDRPQDTLPGEREHLNTPHPLDYSSDNRQRDQKNATAEIDKKSDSNLRKNSSDSMRNQNPIHPSQWSYMSNMPHIYPGTSQNAQLPYSSRTPWNQIQQGFFSNEEFHRNNIFDMKWWQGQRLPLSAHLNINEDQSKGQQEKLDLSRSSQWSFGTRVPKHNERGYDMTRRYARYQSGNYDRNNKNFRDFRTFPPTTSMSTRFKFDSYKIDRRSPLLPDPDLQNHGSGIWRYNNHNRDFPDHSRPQDYSQTYRPLSGMTINNGGFFKRMPQKIKLQIKSTKGKNKVNSKIKGKKVKKKKKKEKKKDSSAELAKKKALAAAANKLKKTFLAAKKNTSGKLNKKSKESIKQNKSSLNEGTINKESPAKAKIQDLSVPKSIPKEGTSLEHDIDIKFSAHEWESVGRGEGGTQNVLDLPSDRSSKSMNESLEEINSDSDSVQTINDDDSVKELSDDDDDDSEKCESSTEEDEEDEEDSMPLNSECRSPTPIRRRHVSESVKLESGVDNHQVKIRRVRSYSTSQMEQITIGKTPLKSSSFLASNLKNMLVKQLLSMDKISLKELVDDPKSRKAQCLISHFMTMHRSVLSQKLNQLRFKSILSLPSNVEETTAYQSFNPSKIDDLPSDLFQQVNIL